MILLGLSKSLAQKEGSWEMTDLVLSLVMLAALALVAGAFVLWRRTGTARQPLLMLLLAAIALANVLIWTLPTPGGEAPVSAIRKARVE